MRFKNITPIVITLILITSLMIIPNPASSQEPFLSYKVKEGKFTVENQYYTIVINLNKGARVIKWFSKESNRDYIPYIVSKEGNISGTQIEVLAPNPVGEYPYVLMDSKWEYEILHKDNFTLIIKFKPKLTEDVRKQLGGLEFSKVFTFYDDVPYVDIEYVVTNPTDEVKTVCTSLRGGCDVGLIIEWGSGNKTVGSVEYYVKYQNSSGIFVTNGTLGKVSLGPWEGNYEGLFWASIYTKVIKDVAAYLIMQPYTVLNATLTVVPGNQTWINTIIVFKKVVLGPKSSITYGLRVYYGPFKVRWLVEGGFKGLAEAIDEAEFSKYLSIVSVGFDLLKERDKAISELKTGLNTLNLSLQTCLGQLKTLQGSYSSLRNEYNDLQEKIKSVENNLALYTGVSLGIGLVIGVAVGYLVRRRIS